MAVGFREVVGRGVGESVGALPSIIIHEARQFELPSGLNIACPGAGGDYACRPMILDVSLHALKPKELRR